MSNISMANDKSFPEKTSRYIFISLSGLFLFFLFFARPYYLGFLKEDGPVEWLTFILLQATGIISLRITLYIKKRYGYIHWFFLLFFAFNFFAGFEEISWGQRILDMKTEGIFAKYSDQNEINLHNTLQGLMSVKTKHIAMYVLFIYGVILPILLKSGRISSNFLNKVYLIVPPQFLTIGFLVATLFMIDVPTGQEEEIGEFLYSLCFLLMMFYNMHLARYSKVFEPSAQFIMSNKTPSFNE